MRTISASLKTHYQGEVTTLVTCWKVTRADATVEGFTNHVENIIYQSVTYKAATGYTASNIHSNADLSVDNLDIYGLLDSDDISPADLRAGLYDYADIEIFQLNYEDLTQGNLVLQTGKLGEITIKDNIFIAEMRSLSQLLQQNIGEVIMPTCRADFGDTRCGIVLSPDDWQASTAYSIGDIVKATTYDARRYICTVSGTSAGSEPTWDTTIGNTTTEATSPAVQWVAYNAYTFEGSPTTVTDTRTFIDTSITNADDVFNGGLLTWLTGDNAGYLMEIKDWTLSTNTFKLFQAMPNTIQTSDTYKVTLGCDKQTATCQSFATENGVQGNIYNFRGEPFLPGNDKISKFGGQ